MPTRVCSVRRSRTSICGWTRRPVSRSWSRSSTATRTAAAARWQWDECASTTCRTTPAAFGRCAALRDRPTPADRLGCPGRPSPRRRGVQRGQPQAGPDRLVWSRRGPDRWRGIRDLAARCELTARVGGAPAQVTDEGSIAGVAARLGQPSMCAAAHTLFEHGSNVCPGSSAILAVPRLAGLSRYRGACSDQAISCGTRVQQIAAVRRGP
jgi:hypothetical protein